MRIFLFAFFLLVISLPIASQSVDVVLTDWPPVEFSAGGEAQGFDPQILRAVFQKMGLTPRFTFYPWERCVLTIQARKAQAIVSLSRTPDREKYVIFPQESLFQSENVLFVRKGKEFSLTSVQDLRGKVIGVTEGYVYGSEFQSARKEKLFLVDEAPTDEMNFRKLSLGRFDAFACDRIVGLSLLKKLGLKEQIVALPFPLSSLKMYVGFVKTPEGQDLADRFDQALAGLKASGEVQRIIDSWIQ